MIQFYKHIPWVYSLWGSDLFYFKDLTEYRKNTPKNYLFTDCKRDHQLANKIGLNCEHLGVIFDGGGFDLNKMKKLWENSNIILVKVFQSKLGRTIGVLKAYNLLTT